MQNPLYAFHTLTVVSLEAEITVKKKVRKCVKTKCQKSVDLISQGFLKEKATKADISGHISATLSQMHNVYDNEADIRNIN